jgi:SAM-dependent methyltransferase
LIDAGQERSFYDAQYARFLALPDHALRIDREVLERNLDDPRHPFYERRRLYRATLAALEAERPKGKVVLDYGCGPADFGLWMAIAGASVTLLDLSPAAIELGLKRAAASGVTVRGIAADATRLDMLGEAEFDLVFACASLHHTLKYPDAVEELARVMRPGGRLVLCETWGGNPFLNAARKLRAMLSREPEEQGEDIIFNREQLRRLDPYFSGLRVDELNLFAMSKRLLRGRFHHAWARGLVAALERFDKMLLRVAPFLRHWSGEAVITARRK